MSRRNARRSAIDVAEYLYRSADLDATVHPGQLRRSRDLFPERYAFLIHGWGVRVEAQAQSYDRFLDCIAGIDAFVAQALITISWPSDDRYRPALQTAKDVAQVLAKVIRNPQYPFSGSRDLVFIGHSMGCRVALELTKLLNADRGFAPRIRLYLMAPAVPVPLVEPQGSLHEAACSAEHSCVYYSVVDQAFILPFQVVETWAGPGQGVLPEPVGRHGRPERGVWKDRACMTPYLHGSYWKSKRVAADIVTDFRRRQLRTLPARG